MFNKIVGYKLVQECFIHLNTKTSTNEKFKFCANNKKTFLAHKLNEQFRLLLFEGYILAKPNYDMGYIFNKNNKLNNIE